MWVGSFLFRLIFFEGKLRKPNSGGVSFELGPLWKTQFVSEQHILGLGF
jgi:hypothetical protein